MVMRAQIITVGQQTCRKKEARKRMDAVSTGFFARRIETEIESNLEMSDSTPSTSSEFNEYSRRP